MHRSALAVLAALAASACTYGSVVDIAPFDARARHAVLSPGDYCEMTLGASPNIISSEGCLRIDWDEARRIHTMTDLSKPEPDDTGSPEDADRQELAVVALGDGLYVAQFDSSDEPGRHELVTFLAKGDAVTGIGVVSDAALRRLAAAHPQMIWENLPPERPLGEPAQLLTSSPLIRSATVEEIKAFLREASVVALREDRPGPEETLSVGIRDRSGEADHPPTQAQLTAGRDLLKLMEQMRN